MSDFNHVSSVGLWSTNSRLPFVFHPDSNGLFNRNFLSFSYLGAKDILMVEIVDPGPWTAVMNVGFFITSSEERRNIAHRVHACLTFNMKITGILL